MAFHSFYQRLDEILIRNLTGTEWAGPLEMERLISPHRLRLPRKVAETAAAAIRAHYEVATQDVALTLAKTDSPTWLWQFSSPVSSPLMAYDFHTTKEGDCQLIEVNTNAAAYLLSCAAAEAHGSPANWQTLDSLQSLENSFRDHSKEAGIASSSPSLFVIVDECLDEQKMRVEFYLYENFFRRRFGVAAQVGEASQIGLVLSQERRGQSERPFVYNRSTDFFLENPQLLDLQNAYRDGKVILAPHPRAYALFADKRRLTELSQPGRLEALGATPSQCSALRKVLIPSHQVADFSSVDEIWQNRKKLFFKPRQSYGGKSVYRGESVSRKVFERLVAEDIVIQKYVPAQGWPTDDQNSYMANWKFDLRFFVYKDQIQMAVARAYQGQVTNFSSPFGGLTVVDFV